MPDRRVGLHERYSLARRNLGFPNTLTVLVQYPSDRAPAVDWLKQRASDLQGRFPLLHALLRDSRTTRPYWSIRAHWTGDELVRTIPFATGTTAREEKESLFPLEWARMSREDFDTRPIWQITLYRGAHRSYVAVSGLHDLFDGIGIIRLAGAVLMSDITSLPYEEVAPPIEDQVDIRPSMLFMLPVVWRALVLPKLPLFLQSWLGPRRPWPSDQVQIKPSDTTPEISILEIQPDLATRLRTVGKRHGAALTPILEVALLVAIWRVHGSAYLESQVPVNLRQQADPYCTGCYVASYQKAWDLSPTLDFWDLVAQVLYITKGDQTALQQAKMRMGLLAYIPNGIRTDPGPTGWENFMSEAMHGNTPYDTTLNLSNLGKVQLPPGALDIVWAAPKSPRGCCYDLCVIGHGDELRLCITWREGAGTDRHKERALESVLETVLQRIAVDHAETELGRLVEET